MINKKTLCAIPAIAALVWAGQAGADEILFMQDFENAHNQNWQTVANPDSAGGITKRSTNSTYTSVTETIRADSSTDYERGGYTNNFAVTGRNWDLHNGNDNYYVSGNESGSNMSGRMLGHEDENYNHYEDNYYQVDGISLHANFESAQLMFDFDSWIEADVDGFAVAYSIDGGAFRLLTPDVTSDMQYSLLGTQPGDDGSLNAMTGGLDDNDPNNDNQIWGFDGHESNMYGTAIFDLSGLSGQLSLRFAFASNSDGSLQEGINIDNIKVTGTCPPGSTGADCAPPPNTGVPEPATAALALIGLTALYRRRKNRV